LIVRVKGYDTEGFATGCFEYYKISQLHQSKTSMLLKVKQTINHDEDDGEGDVDLT